MVENVESDEVRLVKQLGNRSLEIAFNTPEPLEDTGAEVDDSPTPKGEKDTGSSKPASESQQKEQDGQEDEKPLRVRFAVMLKNKDGSGLLVDCTTEAMELQLEGATYSRNVEAHLKSLKGQAPGVPDYQGADILNLNEEISTNFLDFMKSIGITPEVLERIEIIALQREQKMLVKWLGDVHGFFNDY